MAWLARRGALRRGLAGCGKAGEVRSVLARSVEVWQGWHGICQERSEAKMVYQYDWKRSMPVTAQAAGEHLEQLEKIHGEITPKIVLDSARSKDSLLNCSPSSGQ